MFLCSEFRTSLIYDSNLSVNGPLLVRHPSSASRTARLPYSIMCKRSLPSDSLVGCRSPSSQEEKWFVRAKGLTLLGVAVRLCCNLLMDLVAVTPNCGGILHSNPLVYTEDFLGNKATSEKSKQFAVEASTSHSLPSSTTISKLKTTAEIPFIKANRRAMYEAIESDSLIKLMDVVYKIAEEGLKHSLLLAAHSKMMEEILKGGDTGQHDMLQLLHSIPLPITKALILNIWQLIPD